LTPAVPNGVYREHDDKVRPTHFDTNATGAAAASVLGASASLMSISQLIADLFRHRSSPEARAAHEDLAARLYQAELARRALKVGDKAPAFLLPNAEGEFVASDDLLAAGPMVVTFFRGGWCPYCDLTMRAMDTVMPEIIEAGATFVAIWPETGGAALRAKRERGLKYELLVDVDNAVAMQFGIVFRVPDLYRRLLLAHGTDLSRTQGNPSWLLPMPATFIVTPDGVIRYAFVQGDFLLRAEPTEIVERLKRLADTHRRRKR
jgi:peroxiredoxin